MPARTLRNHLPFIILLITLALFGSVTYKNFGISWDEPYFYDYADSIRSAYDPGFPSLGNDPDSIYGVSAEDHKYYGPAYLLLAQPITKVIQTAATRFEAWHLANYGFFVIGVIFFYLILLRWVSPSAAAAAAALFATQPLLIGHAFINPKDVPFLVFCVITAYFGLNTLTSKSGPRSILNTLLFGSLLGLTASVRVIGPLIGVAFAISFILKRDYRALWRLAAASLIAIAAMIVTWPFLWSDPVGNMLLVLQHMSNNPTELAVLYEGVIFRANEMPLFYIPKMLLLTLTEPVWIFALLGSVVFAVRSKYRNYWIEVLPFALVFGFIITYLLVTRPAVYDGFRHFLFILPLVFIAAGFVFDTVFEMLSKRHWIQVIITTLILIPGLIGVFRTHPYEYAYYNSFTGGVGGAYRTYETDYWLTCFKPTITQFSKEHTGETMFIQRELPLAQASAPTNIKLAELPAYTDPPKSGYYLFHTRANLDQRSQYRGLKTIMSVGVDGAEFCLIKQAP